MPIYKTITIIIIKSLFNGGHIDIHSLYKNRKKLNSKNFKKRIHFPILKETQPTTFFQPIGAFSSLGLEIFRVTLRDLGEILV